MAFENSVRGWLNGVQAGSADIEVNAVTVEHIAPGAVQPSVIGLSVYNGSGSPMTAGQLVYVSGWSETQGLPLITLADADAGGARAQYVLGADLADATAGTAYKQYRFTGVDTDAASAAGDPVYLHTTAGGWTLTAPSGGDDIVQIVGHVAVDAVAGEIEFNLSYERHTKGVGTNELQDLAVTAAKIAANTITSSEVAPSLIQYAAVQVTNSQIKAMRAAPVQVVAAPGAAKIIQFLGAILTLDAGANVLSESGCNLVFKYTNGSGAAVSTTVEATGFIDQAGDTMTTATPLQDAIVAKAGCENQVLCIHNVGAGEIAGNAANDALLYVHVAYRVINSNW